jgi:DNA gyrase/topoisomerase IV subunit B
MNSAVRRNHRSTPCPHLNAGEGKEVDEADDIFTKLMGELVEPRRDFIQENVLTARVDV